MLWRGSRVGPVRKIASSGAALRARRAAIWMPGGLESLERVAIPRLPLAHLWIAEEDVH